MGDVRRRSKIEMQNELEGALLRLAFCEIQEEETLQLLDQSSDELDHFVRTQRSDNFNFIRKKVRQKRTVSLIKNSIPQFAKVAASILLVFFIGFTTALATVRGVRVKVLELLINIEKAYTEISLKENEDKVFYVPKEWNGDFYPSYIPDGFVLDVVDNNPPASVEYRNSNGNVLSFTEGTVDSQSNIDTEDSGIKYVFINGRQALTAQKNGRVLIAWSEYSHYFILFFPGDYNTAVRVAESVRRIN